MAAAVTNLFPGAQCGIGPATDEGFFYDFIVDRPFIPGDLEAIEKKMKELAQQDLPYERQLWPRDQAMAFFAKHGEPLKVQLIEEKTEAIRKSPATDQDKRLRRLLRRSHVPTPQAEGVQSAQHVERYWKAMRGMRRCSASTARRFCRQGSEGYLTQVEEAKKRDHRKLGRELGLFRSTSGTGRRVLARKGTRVYNTLANYMLDVLFPAGYVEVKTPLIYNKSCGTIGTLKHYRKDMFLIESRASR